MEKAGIQNQKQVIRVNITRGRLGRHGTATSRAALRWVWHHFCGIPAKHAWLELVMREHWMDLGWGSLQKWRPLLFKTVKVMGEGGGRARGSLQGWIWRDLITNAIRFWQGNHNHLALLSPSPRHNIWGTEGTSCTWVFRGDRTSSTACSQGSGKDEW